MTTTIVFTCDNAEDALDVISTVLCNGGDHRARLTHIGEPEPEYTVDDILDDYNADLDAISGASDLVRGRTPRRARDVTCPHCGAKPGDFCKPPTGPSNYGTTFTHAARKLAAKDDAST